MSFTNEDALSYYKAIDALVTKYTNDKGKIDYKPFWDEVHKLDAVKLSEKVKDLDVKLGECGVGYINTATEYRG